MSPRDDNPPSTSEYSSMNAFNALPSPHCSPRELKETCNYPQKPAIVKMPAEPPSPPASPWAVHSRKVLVFDAGAPSEQAEEAFVDPPLYFTDNGHLSHEALFLPAPGGFADGSRSRDLSYHFVQPKSKRDTRTKRYHMPIDGEHSQTLTFSLRLNEAFRSDPLHYYKTMREELMQNRGIASLKAANLNRVKQEKANVSIRASDKPFQKLRKHTPRLLLPTSKASASKLGNPHLSAGRYKVQHTRAPSVKRPEDTNFETLEDFSPPTSTLLNNNKALKIEWSSHNPLDLTSDPHRHLLHDAELLLASTLRLSCATYLCSKRRIFKRVHEAHDLGREFRKTDAQQACQIDVNKASKLWVAFEKVGWFNHSHFKRLQRKDDQEM